MCIMRFIENSQQRFSMASTRHIYFEQVVLSRTTNIQHLATTTNICLDNEKFLGNGLRPETMPGFLSILMPKHGVISKHEVDALSANNL